jgi:hypothetical protein
MVNEQQRRDARNRGLAILLSGAGMMLLGLYIRHSDMLATGIFTMAAGAIWYAHERIKDRSSLP